MRMGSYGFHNNLMMWTIPDSTTHWWTFTKNKVAVTLYPPSKAGRTRGKAQVE